MKKYGVFFQTLSILFKDNTFPVVLWDFDL